MPKNFCSDCGGQLGTHAIKCPACGHLSCCPNKVCNACAHPDCITNMQDTRFATEPLAIVRAVKILVGLLKERHLENIQVYINVRIEILKKTKF